MKRSFVGPVWLLLVLGVIQGMFAWGVLQLLSALNMRPGGLRPIGTVTILYVAMWPSILLLEAVVYWLIRRRNNVKRLSWAHSVIFCCALLLNDFVALLLILHSPLVAVMYTRGGRNVEIGTFWVLILLAHAAFVQVLILAFRKPEPVNKEGDANILDDVVL